MGRKIEAGPREGKVVILEDDVSGIYDVAHWSPEAGEWIGENGEPSKITPSHWHPLPGENYLQQGLDVSSSPSQGGPSVSLARRFSFFPFSLRRASSMRRLMPAAFKRRRIESMRCVSKRMTFWHSRAGPDGRRSCWLKA